MISECVVLAGRNKDELNKLIAESIAAGFQPLGGAFAIPLPMGEIRVGITMVKDSSATPKSEERPRSK